MFGLVGTSLKMRFIIDRGLNQKIPCQHQIFIFLKVLSRSSKSQISLLWEKKKKISTYKVLFLRPSLGAGLQ